MIYTKHKQTAWFNVFVHYTLASRRTEQNINLRRRIDSCLFVKSAKKTSFFAENWGTMLKVIYTTGLKK